MTNIDYYYKGETKTAEVVHLIPMGVLIATLNNLFDTFDGDAFARFAGFDFYCRLYLLRMYTNAVTDEMVDDPTKAYEFVYESDLYDMLTESDAVNAGQWDAIQTALRDFYDSWSRRSKWEALADMGIGLLAKLDETLGGADLAGLVKALEQHGEQQKTPEKGAQDAQEDI